MTAPTSAHAVVQDVSSSSKLDVLVASGACEEGRVVALDFAAVRTRLGDRWPMRRVQVWDHVERSLARTGASALHHRLDDTRFLVAFANLRGAEALSAAFHLMGAILAHFLGQVSDADRVVHTVMSASGGEVTVGGGVAEPSRSFAPGGSPPLTAALARPSAGAVIMASTGQALRLTPSEEDMIDLRKQAVVGRRLAIHLRREGSDEALSGAALAGLPTRDLLTIKMQVMDALDDLVSRTPKGLIVAPLSLLTLGSSQARFATLERLYRLSPEQRGRLTVEVMSIDGGTPVVRLQETLFMLRPVCRTVICRAIPTHSCISVIREAGVRAVTVSAQDVGAKGEKLAAGLMAFAEAAKSLATVRVAASLDNPAQLAICTLAGYTHATLACADLKG